MLKDITPEALIACLAGKSRRILVSESDLISEGGEYIKLKLQQTCLMR